MREPEKIKPIVKGLMVKLRKGNVPVIRDKWGEILGDDVASHTTPYLLREGKLFIEVDSSAWFQELTIRRKEVLDKLTLFFGNGIKELCFKHIR